VEPVADSGVPSTTDQVADGPDVETIVMARVSTGPRKAKHDAFVDFELHGLRSRILRICSSLVQHELSLTFPADVDLETRVVRPCSAAAMAEPEGSTEWVMARLLPIDAPDLMLMAAERGNQDEGTFQGVRVQRRELTGHETEAQCQRSLDRLKSAQEQADKRAENSAKSWLDGQVELQEKKTTESCRPDPKGKACTQARMILELLRSRAARPAGTASSSSTPTPSSSTICRRR
jgi:hypothetical protein